MEAGKNLVEVWLNKKRPELLYGGSKRWCNTLIYRSVEEIFPGSSDGGGGKNSKA